MHDAVLLPARACRSAGGAPTLTTVVDAMIDGHPVEWEAAVRRGRTPAERQMTRELRALAYLSRGAVSAQGQPIGRRARPPRLERTLMVLASMQVLVGLALGLLGAWRDVASGWRVACMAGTVAGALILVRRGRVSRPASLLGHAMLLIAAAQARPFLDLSTGASPPLWVRAPWQALCAEAFLPVAAWRLATGCPPVARCSSFEQVSATVLALALACSVITAAVCGLAALGMPVIVAMSGPQLTLLMTLTWGGVAAATMVVRGRTLSPCSDALVPSTALAPWRPAMSSRLAGVVGMLRGTPATRLAGLGADLLRARSPREVATALATHVGAALDGPIAIIAPGVATWTTLVGRLPALRADSAVAALLVSADEAIDVDPRTHVCRLLPDSDRDWLSAASVSTIVRLASREGDTLAGLLVGPSPGGRSHGRRDRAFITAAARAAALALDAIARRPDALPCRPEDEDLSYECQSCGGVSVRSDACECGGARHLAALPACLHGTFRVERRIGRGGMGVVYLARDLRLDRAVALKTLPSLSPSLVSTLRAEARAMAALAHPSVAVLYGMEQWRGTPVLVTEYMAGGTLASRIAAGPVPLPEAVRLGAMAADSLAALHERGWLHRDVKPGNIGFSDDGTLKLLDFGLSRWRALDDESWSPLAGTPLYLSPELLEGDPVSTRDDVWALALVVVEMVTGVHPMHAACLEHALQPRGQAAMDVSTCVPKMPPGLMQVLARALHPSPSQRIVDARALAIELRAAAAAAAAAAA